VPDLFAPSLLIEPKVGGRLSKTQQRFNALIQKVERLRAHVVEWRDVVPREIERIQRTHAPLRDMYRALRIEFVALLDRAASERRMTKNERKKLRHLIPAITAELVAEQPDETLKALHDKYSDLSFDEQSSMVNETIKSAVEDIFGVEIGDDVDIADPGQLSELAEKIEQQQRDDSERRRSAEARSSKRRGSAHSADPQARRLADAAQVKKSLQEIYRKLASALHPDRASDEGERLRRTGLMQRANVAYEARDLLQLLELQLEIELVDASRIAVLPEERLRHYVSILEEQCAELQQALDDMQTPIRLQLDLSPFAKLSVKSVIAEVERGARELNNSIAALRHDLGLLADLSRVKAWLRDYQLPEAEPELDELMSVVFNISVPTRHRR
jgi:hypothetical protein